MAPDRIQSTAHDWCGDAHNILTCVRCGYSRHAQRPTERRCTPHSERSSSGWLPDPITRISG